MAYNSCLYNCDYVVLCIQVLYKGIYANPGNFNWKDGC